MITTSQTKLQKTPSAKTKSRRGSVAGHPSKQPPLKADLIKVGVDVGYSKYAVCRQIDNSLQEPPRMISPDHFKTFILKQLTLARRVIFCYEASVFGFELARWARQNGIEVIVMAPVKLDEANRRVETDKLNARDILGRLDRYLSGNTRSLTPCRIPSRQEELLRSQTRQRDQLLEARNRATAQGRCLLWQFGYTQPQSRRWWREPVWQELVLEPELRQGLERLRSIILAADEQLRLLHARLYQQAKTLLPIPINELPRGVGWLSMLILSWEMADWNRFSNRQQVGCFTGLVPSEASTGQSRRTGSVTKVGSPRIRKVLVEMAWRMVRYQPRAHAVARWTRVLSSPARSKVARKRAIVATARQLAVDLWRLATGQTTAQNLNFTL